MAAPKENAEMTVITPDKETSGRAETLRDDVAIWVAVLKKNYGSIEAVRGIDLAVGRRDLRFDRSGWREQIPFSTFSAE
jgi:hypothetical protein